MLFRSYVHRIGRTGRAGATGEAISLVCVDEFKLLVDIEKLIKRQLPQEIIDGFIPDPHAKAQPIQLRSFGGQGQGQGRSNGGGASRSGNRQAKPANSGSGSREGNPSRPSTRPVVKQSTPRRSGGRGNV